MIHDQQSAFVLYLKVILKAEGAISQYGNWNISWSLEEMASF
jgi:hypothetical protein